MDVYDHYGMALKINTIKFKEKRKNIESNRIRKNKMSTREQFEENCKKCKIQIDCDECYIKYLEQQIEAKDKVIEVVKKWHDFCINPKIDSYDGVPYITLMKVYDEYEASHE